MVVNKGNTQKIGFSWDFFVQNEFKTKSWTCCLYSFHILGYKKFMRWIFSHCSQNLFSQRKEKIMSCFVFSLSRFCEENFGNIFTQAYI